MKYLMEDGADTTGMVSVSQIQTFLSCKHKWKYSYIDKIMPRVERAYLTIGKLCHEAMRAAMEFKAYHPESTWEAQRVFGVHAMEISWQTYIRDTPLLDEEIPILEETLRDAKSVFTQAFEEFEPNKYEVYEVGKNPALELHFWVPCGNEKGLHGYVDAILKEKETGFIWCTDYKFRKSLAPDEDEQFNIQNSVYAYACQKMEIPITGTMTWQHLNTPAADPKVNKDGSISTAKIKTTWKRFAEFCEEHGQDPEDYYMDVEPKLREIEWFRATYEYRNPETVDRIWNECVYPQAHDIDIYRDEVYRCDRSLYPWNCRLCEYSQICQAELRDYDVEAIIEREFTKRGSRAESVAKI